MGHGTGVLQGGKEKAFWQRSLSCFCCLWVYRAHDNSSSSSLQMPAEWEWIHVVALWHWKALGQTDPVHVWHQRQCWCGETAAEADSTSPSHGLPVGQKWPKVTMTLENMSDFIIIMQMFFWEGMYYLVLFRLTSFLEDGSELYCSVQNKQVYLIAEEEKSTKRKTQLIHSQWYFSIWTIELRAEYSGTSLLKWIVCW